MLNDEVPLPLHFPLPPSLPGSVPIASTSSAGPPRAAALALAYARAHFGPFYTNHFEEIHRLIASTLYLPLPKLYQTPYKDIFSPYPGLPLPVSALGEPSAPSPNELHEQHLVPLFVETYCVTLSLPREAALRVITDVGGSGALAKLAKVRSVMKEKKTGWSQSEELPIEIAPPLPAYRYHSVFACPVSKEQTTEDDTNPPMMMICGHVIAKESLNRLAKGGQ